MVERSYRFPPTSPNTSLERISISPDDVFDSEAEALQAATSRTLLRIADEHTRHKDALRRLNEKIQDINDRLQEIRKEER